MIKFLVFAVPPVMILRPAEDYRVFEGDEVRLECHASGIPRPKISWKHNGNLVAEKQDALVIKEMKRKDNGTYKCIARNEAGKVTATTILSIKGNE